jgi:CHAT domain-containing protein
MANQVLIRAEEVDSDYLVANARLELGSISIGLNAPAVAQRQLSASLEIYQSLNLPVRQAEALHGLARTAQAQGDLVTAISYGERSLQMIEALRVNVADPELRAFYSSRRRGYHETQIGLLMDLRDSRSSSASDAVPDALAVSERSRARMTVELLNEASVDPAQGMDPELKNQRSELFVRLAELRYQRNKLINKAETENTPADSLDAIIREMSETEHALNLLDTRFRRSDPYFAELHDPSVLSASEIQSLLDADTSLLQYALGDERSFVWLVTSDAIVGIELAAREVINSAARQAFSSLQNYKSDAASRAESSAQLHALAELVMAPVEDLIVGRRLLIAADGALQYVPFGVLPMQRLEGQRLLESYEIVQVPSMSALVAQRGRPVLAAPERTLLVLADPVFAADDPRFDPDHSPRLQMSVVNSARMTRYAAYLDNLERLAYTGREAEAIASLVPDASRTLMTGFDANRDAVFDTDLSQYRYVHFATHGLIDSRYPMLSALALSRYGRDGKPRDALLRLANIYDLRLNADLLVLSACETALGREIRGEGLVGLAQGFLYAGARSLVVSLWRVPDRATSELMSRFYRYLFEEELSPADALRRAKLSVASERRWRDPYFWAAMMLVGDWQ